MSCIYSNARADDDTLTVWMFETTRMFSIMMGALLYFIDRSDISASEDLYVRVLQSDWVETAVTERPQS